MPFGLHMFIISQFSCLTHIRICFSHLWSRIELYLLCPYGLKGLFAYLKCDFNAESEQGVAQAILRGLIDFKRDPWPNISDSAKSLVRQMLEPDPKLRLTAKQVLGNYSLF